nr:MAG TPA: hypothetical protein [Caudoviricetes sp.]
MAIRKFVAHLMLMISLQLMVILLVSRLIIRSLATTSM